jgi:serine/threonine-protein kinase
VDDLIGKQLGQYEIIDELGRGGMATVYRARQPSINRMVAIKVLPRHFLHDPSFIERFKREVDVISRLEHPHILPIYDFGETDGVPFIAMRFLGGGSLADYLRRARPTLADLERPLTQISEALDYAHKEGIVHRDLKPGNILLDDNNNAYLTDFGVARIMDSNLTGSAIIGTPAYMSPEQANGLALDGRSDIYALGVVLFEAIAGREPYEAPTPMALLYKHISEPMPSVRSIRPDVPVAIDAVVAKATAKEPDQRYASAIEMAEAYEVALGEANQAQTASHREPATLVDTGDVAPAQVEITGMRDDAPTMPPTPQPVRHHVLADPVHPTPTAEFHAPVKTRRAGLYAGIGAAVVVALIIAGVILAPRLTPSAVIALPTPTPFANAGYMTGDHYQVTIPDAWVQTRRAGTDATVWRTDDRDAWFTLALREASLEDADDFPAAISDYDAAVYSDFVAQPSITLIDESTAPDGSLRRSYRIDEDYDEFAPGQIDVFYLNREAYLVVVETYSAYAAGNEFVDTFQDILDSMRIQ